MSESNGLAPLGGEVKIPVGGDFIPSGMIALWRASVLYTIYSKTDIGMAEIVPPAGLVIRKMGDGFRYYHKSSDEIGKVKDALGETFNPAQAWVWSCAKSTVLNVPSENLDKFNDPISMECKVATLGSKKSRHELHLIALPALVYSVAHALGYNPPTISFSDLIGNQVIFDDAFQARMIGNGDAKESDAAHYTKSQLWLQRVGLWSALGESNPLAYYPKGKGTKYDAVSDKLSQCLAYLTHDWGTGMWGRLVQVPDPRVDATYGEDKRLTIPAFMEIFASEAAARTVAVKENLEREARKNGGEAANGDTPRVPDAWSSDPDAWTTWIAQVKGQLAGKPLPAVRAAVEKVVADGIAKGEPVGATVDEIMAALK